MQGVAVQDIFVVELSGVSGDETNKSVESAVAELMQVSLCVTHTHTHTHTHIHIYVYVCIYIYLYI
jgi:hypothetical protein